MRDTELYWAILGLAPPWTVISVDLDVKGQRVTVTMEAGSGPFRCPECQAEVQGYDHKPRRWQDGPGDVQ